MRWGETRRAKEKKRRKERQERGRKRRKGKGERARREKETTQRKEEQKKQRERREKKTERGTREKKEEKRKTFQKRPKETGLGEIAGPKTAKSDLTLLKRSLETQVEKEALKIGRDRATRELARALARGAPGPQRQWARMIAEGYNPTETGSYSGKHLTDSVVKSLSELAGKDSASSHRIFQQLQRGERPLVPDLKEDVAKAITTMGWKEDVEMEDIAKSTDRATRIEEGKETARDRPEEPQPERDVTKLRQELKRRIEKPDLTLEDYRRGRTPKRRRDVKTARVWRTRDVKTLEKRLHMGLTKKDREPKDRARRRPRELGDRSQRKPSRGATKFGQDMKRQRDKLAAKLSISLDEYHREPVAEGLGVMSEASVKDLLEKAPKTEEEEIARKVEEAKEALRLYRRFVAEPKPDVAGKEEPGRRDSETVVERPPRSLEPVQLEKPEKPEKTPEKTRPLHPEFELGVHRTPKLKEVLKPLNIKVGRIRKKLGYDLLPRLRDQETLREATKGRLVILTVGEGKALLTNAENDVLGDPALLRGPFSEGWTVGTNLPPGLYFVEAERQKFVRLDKDLDVFPMGKPGESSRDTAQKGEYNVFFPRGYSWKHLREQTKGSSAVVWVPSKGEMMTREEGRLFKLSEALYRAPKHILDETGKILRSFLTLEGAAALGLMLASPWAAALVFGPPFAKDAGVTISMAMDAETQVELEGAAKKFASHIAGMGIAMFIFKVRNVALTGARAPPTAREGWRGLEQGRAAARRPDRAVSTRERLEQAPTQRMVPEGRAPAQRPRVQQPKVQEPSMREPRPEPGPSPRAIIYPERPPETPTLPPGPPAKWYQRTRRATRPIEEAPPGERAPRPGGKPRVRDTPREGDIHGTLRIWKPEPYFPWIDNIPPRYSPGLRAKLADNPHSAAKIEYTFRKAGFSEKTIAEAIGKLEKLAESKGLRGLEAERALHSHMETEAGLISHLNDRYKASWEQIRGEFMKEEQVAWFEARPGARAHEDFRRVWELEPSSSFHSGSPAQKIFEAETQRLFFDEWFEIRRKHPTEVGGPRSGELFGKVMRKAQTEAAKYVKDLLDMWGRGKHGLRLLYYDALLKDLRWWSS